MKRFKVQQVYLAFIMLILSGFLITGCGSGGGEVTEHWAPGTTVPTVTAVFPLIGAINVAINTKIITATFSEAMDPATLTTASFKLECPAGTPVTGAVTYLAAGNVASLTLPSTPDLPDSTVCTATVTTGAKNLAGSALASNFVWTFTTGLAADTIAPTLITTSASDGDTGLPVNRDDTATFSEPMDPATLASPAISYKLTLFESADPIAGAVSYSGYTATFNPTSDLLPNTKYTSTITTGAKDMSGNALVPGLRENPWSWTTGPAPDILAPTVTETDPVHLATDVPVDKIINATFSEEMRQATMITTNFTVKETVFGTAVTGTVAYDVENKKAIFSPLTVLKADTDYTVKVLDGAQDLAGNALVVPSVDGLPVPNPWTFRTAVESVLPPDLAINLRSAKSFGIASRAGMTSTGITEVNGDIALYPLASCTDSTGNTGASQTCLVKTYSSPTGMTVNGSIYYAADPFDNGGTALTVTNDLNTAWIEGKNKVNTEAVGFLGGELGGKTIFPGVYEEASTLQLSVGTVATLDAEGDANAIFIFKVGSSLTDYGILSNKTRIDLIHGAQARNVWFVIGVSATIGAGTTWNGNILAGSTITVNSDSTVNGRILSGADLSGGLLTLINSVAAPAVTTITVPAD